MDCIVSGGELKQIKLDWKPGYSVCVVMASSGYPGKYEKEHEIKGLDSFNENDDIYVFHAGTKYSNSKTVTNGGRVLGVTAVGDDLVSTIDKTYTAVNKINCPNLFNRTDIGKKALKYFSIE